MTNDFKKNSQIASLIILFLFIISYAFYVSHDLIFGVKIKNVKIDSIEAKEGMLVDHSAIKISGTAKNAVNITLNGREISVDDKGNWNETVALLNGYNIISVVAKDRFGYYDSKYYKLTYKNNDK
jgi:hypothetical protein